MLKNRIDEIEKSVWRFLIRYRIPVIAESGAIWVTPRAIRAAEKFLSRKNLSEEEYAELEVLGAITNKRLCEEMARLAKVLREGKKAKFRRKVPAGN